MNNANQISKQTQLFGYIGEHAGSSRFSTLLNKLFKANQDDFMMLPMNIRRDDFFFTLSNMKNSHVNGAILSNEYVTQSLDIVDEASALARRSGMCDIVFREGEKLRGDIYSIRVLLEQLKDFKATKIAIIGTNPHAKALSLLACGFQLSYFNDNLEELNSFCEEMELHQPDLNRIAPDMQIDLSGFDAVLDFSELANFDMVTKLALYNFDMKNTQEYSALKSRAAQLGAEYRGYESMIDALTQQAYRAIKKG